MWHKIERAAVVSGIVLLLLQAGLLLLIRIKYHVPDILAVTPKSGQVLSLNTEWIEEKNGQGMLTASVEKENQVVENSRKSLSVSLFYTQYTWPAVMAYQMVHGSFFSAGGTDGFNPRTAVLNREAAFQLCGSLEAGGTELTIGGEFWQVTGVIDDLQEDPRVYLPSSFSQGNPQLLAAALGQDGASPGLIRQRLKEAGLLESHASFTNLALLRQGFYGRLRLGIQTLFLYLSFYILLFCLRKVLSGRKMLTDLMRRFNGRQILRQYPGLCLSSAVWPVAGALCLWGCTALMEAVYMRALDCRPVIFSNPLGLYGWMPSLSTIYWLQKFSAVLYTVQVMLLSLAGICRFRLSTGDSLWKKSGVLNTEESK